jgi:hypothetical protein
VTVPHALGALDAAVGIYLLVWALRRQQRDKPLVALVGAVLTVCAVFLLAAASNPAPPDQQPPSVGPAPGVPV